MLRPSRASPSPSALDTPPSPDLIDLDFDLPDFDPVKEWLIDPDSNPPMSDPTAVPDKPADSPIDEKLEKFGLEDCSELHAEVIGDGITASGGSAVGDAHSVSDSIKAACDDSGGSEDLVRRSSSSSGDDESSSSEEGGGGAEMEEMREPDEEEMNMWSGEDEAEPEGPIKLRHEIEDLPPVPQVEASLEPHHRTLPVGVISSILGPRIIVEGSQNHKPLCEGSVLWITDTRSPLGLVDEIFGPVKSPFYVVRYNSDKELPAGICMGTAVSFVEDFASAILNENDLYKKGYDASGENDEEDTEEVEFSDDEKEAVYRRSLRQLKRETDNRSHEKREAAYSSRSSSNGGLAGDMRYGNRYCVKNRINFRGLPSHRSQQPGTNTKTNFKRIPHNDSWHWNKKGTIDKRSNFMLPSGSGQPMPSVPSSFQLPNGNAFGCIPPMPATFTQSSQPGSYSSDPSQQFLLQQVNTLLGCLPPQQLQMISQGGYPMNALPTPSQIQIFNGPNVAQYQQQFSSTIGAVPNLPRPGEPTNFSVGSASLAAAGQSNVGQASFGSSSGRGHSYGQPPPAIDQRGMNAIQFRAGSVGEEGQSNAGFSSAGQCTTGQSYGQPPLAIDQRGMPRTQFSQSVQPTLLGSEGQSNAGAAGQFGVGQASFGCSNGQSYGQPPQAIDQGGIRSMQLNPYVRTPSHRAAGQFVAGQAGLVWNDVQEKGCSGPQNNPNAPPSTDQSVIYSTQFNPSVGHSPIGEAWQSNPINQDGKYQPAQFNSSNGPEPFTDAQISIGQGAMHPSMHFNSSIAPTSLGSIGQSSAVQTPFRYGNMQEHMALGSKDLQSYAQPQTSGRGGRYSPMRFNRGRSFRGRNHYPRGRHFGSHGRPQNRYDAAEKKQGERREKKNSGERKSKQWRANPSRPLMKIESEPSSINLKLEG